MFFKAVFAVVVSIALTSALPIVEDFGGSLPSPLKEIDRDISGTLDSIMAQLSPEFPLLSEFPAPGYPFLPGVNV